jgi:hypothetical protein
MRNEESGNRNADQPPGSLSVSSRPRAGTARAEGSVSEAEARFKTGHRSLDSLRSLPMTNDTLPPGSRDGCPTNPFV